jgi:hypothetical protein
MDRAYGQSEEKREGARIGAGRAQDILKNHRPDPLDAKLVAELQSIMHSGRIAKTQVAQEPGLIHFFCASRAYVAERENIYAAQTGIA